MKACIVKSLLVLAVATSVNTWTYAHEETDKEFYPVVENTKAKSNIKTVFLDGFQGEPVWRRPRDKVIAIGDAKDVSGLVVLAEDYNFVDQSAGNASCDSPFEPNSFKGAIVVCQAADISVEQQAENVARGGASALILLHARPDAKFERSESKVPVVHLDADVLWTFKNWVKYSEPGSASLNIANAALD